MMILAFFLLYLVIGFFKLKYFDENTGSWLAMIAYNAPGLAVLLYFLSLLFWPYPKLAAHIVIPFLKD